MGGFRIKTKYKIEGNFDDVEERVLYAEHNTIVDYVTFYNEDGVVLFSIPQNLDNNMLDAINRLYNPFKSEENYDYLNDVESMSEEEKSICRM